MDGDTIKIIYNGYEQEVPVMTLQQATMLAMDNAPSMLDSALRDYTFLAQLFKAMKEENDGRSRQEETQEPVHQDQ